jgi:RNA polymerase sigma-70 factor (ECF subfamily)
MAAANERPSPFQSFEADRERLRKIAYRLLGSASDADDAVQEAWLRLRSVDADEVNNLHGWMTTVVSRIALDMLRARKTRREEPLVVQAVEPILNRELRGGPEQDALLAEAVGIGLMIVLDRLEPPERLAFVLHDIFGVGFADIAPIVGRSTAAARQLASRARRRLHGVGGLDEPSLELQRRVVGAFFAASRDGNFQALLEVLDPDATLRVDVDVTLSGDPIITTGADAIAKRAQYGAAARGRWSEMLLIDGKVGIVVAPFGQVRMAMTFELAADRIRRIEITTKPESLAALELCLFA